MIDVNRDQENPLTLPSPFHREPGGSSPRSHRAKTLIWAALLLIFEQLSTGAFASPEIPGAPQQRPIALVGATVHPVCAPAIPNGIVLFAEGKISAVGTNVDIPADAEQIAISADKHVYPGLIDAYTDLGLVEVAAVRASRDQAEGGELNPNVKAQVALNPDSELIPVARSNGVLSVLTAPRGGLICGTSAVMNTDGWTWEDMTIAAPVAMHLSWPRTLPLPPFLAIADESRESLVERREKALRALAQAVADSRAYAAAKQTPNGPESPGARADSRWEAMLPVIEGRVPVIIAADELRQIQSAVAFAERERLRLVILGAYDAPRCAELLTKNDVPVIVGGVLRLPLRPSDAHDEPYTLPARLYAAGIRFCIASADEASNVRNLPYHAAMAAAYGLPKDEAMKAITLHAAQILGVGERLGSLEAGKDATLIVTDGDPLEVPTHVEIAFIQGRKVDLSDKQKRLWAKYQEKYRRAAGGKLP